MNDVNLLFCTANNVFGNGTTELGATSNWIDFKVAQDNGAGVGPVMEVVVTTAFSGGTGATFQIAAVDSAGSNAVVLDSTPFIANANLTVGAIIHLQMSPQRSLPGATLTHLRMRCANSGNNTTGAVTAHLLDAVGGNPTKAYAAGW